VLDPVGHLHHAWEILGGLLLAAAGSLFLAQAYIANKCERDPACAEGDMIYGDLSGILATAEALLAAFFVLELLVKFRTGYYDEASGALVTDPAKCAWYYLSHGFIFDFATAIPWDLVVQYLKPPPPLPPPLTGRAKLAAALLSNPQVRHFWRGFRESKVFKVSKLLRNHGANVGKELVYAATPTAHGKQVRESIRKAVKAKAWRYLKILKYVGPLIKEAKFLNNFFRVFLSNARFVRFALEMTRLRWELREHHAEITKCQNAVRRRLACRVAAKLRLKRNRNAATFPEAGGIFVLSSQEIVLPSCLRPSEEKISFCPFLQKQRKSERRRIRTVSLPQNCRHRLPYALAYLLHHDLYPNILTLSAFSIE
jgi:hypothetical protein